MIRTSALQWSGRSGVLTRSPARTGRSRLLLRSALLGLWLAIGYAGEIRSHVTITQGLTKKRVTLPAYQLRGVPVKAPRQIPPSVDELSRVAIYLEGPNLRAGTPLHLEMAQQNRLFEPDILVVPVGSTIAFPNSDPIFHNVFSLSKVKQFDLGYYGAGQSRTQRFDKPGVVRVYCHLHPNMNAAVLVVASAWYGRPGSDGILVLAGVPAGSYRIVAWHKSAGFLLKKVQVPQNGSVDIELSLPLLGKQED
jgi:plastocyanin